MTRLRAVVRDRPDLCDRAHRRLSAAECGRLAAEIIVAYVLVRRMIHGHPLPTLLERLRGGIHDGGVPVWEAADEHITAVRVGRAVARLLPKLPGDTRCLTQALVVTRLLARRGIGSTVLIAVQPGPDFEAHAWVEHGGVPVLTPGAPGFDRLTSL